MTMVPTGILDSSSNGWRFAYTGRIQILPTDFFPIILGMSSSQLTNTHIFFRGVGLNHQPVSVSEPVEIGML